MDDTTANRREIVKDKVQGLMNAHAEAVKDLESVLARRAAATAKLVKQLRGIQSQIGDIEVAFAVILKEAKSNEEATLMHLRVTADNAQRQGEFPEGKKRLPLDGGAWVQVSEKKGFKVVDPSQVVRHVVDKGLEDTVIKSLALDRDAVNAIFTLEKKFPGVEQTTTRTVSVSLPKEGK